MKTNPPPRIPSHTHPDYISLPFHFMEVNEYAEDLWNVLWRKARRLIFAESNSITFVSLKLKNRDSFLGSLKAFQLLRNKLLNQTKQKFYPYTRAPFSRKTVNGRHCCSVVQSVQFFVTPWTAASQASISFTLSWSLLILIFIESVMPSNHLIFYHPLFLPPSIFPSIRVFSNELVLYIKWPKY